MRSKRAWVIAFKLCCFLGKRDYFLKKIFGGKETYNVKSAILTILNE